MNQPLWTPSEESIRNSRLTDFQKFVERSQGKSFKNYSELHKWSVDFLPEFWASIWEYAPVIHSQKYEHVLIRGKRFQDSRFFPGARLNFAENLLRKQDDSLAIFYRGESGAEAKLTYSELFRKVGELSSYFLALGIRPGDRIAGLMPNIPDTVVGMLAATTIGAVWSSCSPDFGSKGVLDRFGQIRPSVLLTTDRYEFKGKSISLSGIVGEIVSQLPELKSVVIAKYPSLEDRSKDLTDSFPKNSIALQDAISAYAGKLPNFIQLPFDHPVYVMYSSGTTGLPKCMVQGPGVFLNHWKELALHTDLREGEGIFYYTTCGWMMWNWLVSSLSIGATIHLFDGNPFHPDPGVLFRYASDRKIGIFGVGAKYILSLEKEKFKPESDLSSVRAVLSTGSPLPSYGFEYVYEFWNKKFRLSSISGGTDLNGCFALGNPNIPVHSGELQSLGLGMDVRIFDDSGKSVRGEKGELVCVQPFPSMPLEFWSDQDGKKYQEAYFDTYSDVWRHGDFAEILPDEGMVVYGRSDATLNPGGVRIGTADLYSLLETVPEIADSVVIGQDWKDDVRIVLFLKMTPGSDLNSELESRIKKEIKEKVSPRHVPSKIIAVPDIPYTRNMKKVEIAVKKTVQGQAVTNQDALINPESLEYFRNLPALSED
ncbi:acetoacetate--CoA ligase [Leptospira wolffii]|uniref:acetoacetate--CoA ligase n=1 Tax=Leptospira wolffii TaxID=409998 RepID=UPI001082A003|nr:acetoacetate--CoA ligase [Leptospira wolffii]TGK62794.1 acetoacetate--CoA ligase [Leptospira wolffii]TGK67670.1 acetoacetate--CoA ligase [Leptospira wolffii]TGK73819.1 acetoacetate--CoA ligase [Leptospira wolffii]TGL28681.1 acetoacetate--CoA ligase [Leptospira wolffii]